MIIWALFDSGNGCYKQVADTMGYEVYAIGMDRENKNSHFINLDLSNYKYMFGDKELWNTLDKLPKPDLIIASPPCESWSVASAMNGGNACWKTDTMENLFGTMKGSNFVIRDYEDYENYQYIPENQILTRINGELCIYNTVQIIKKYKPKYWVIENPAYGKIWEYIEKILGWRIPYENLTYYNAYGFEIKKPTRFSSNLELNLKKDKIPNKIAFGLVRGYNNRSNIPTELIEQIFTKIEEKIND